MAQNQKQYHREVANRVFAKELADTTLVIERDPEDQYAPQYVMTPTGAKVNRVFFVGTLADITDIGDDAAYWRARIADPTGTFVAYAGEYQPEASQMLSSADIPMIMGVVGKVSVYLPDGDDAPPVLSIRPERVVPLDAVARDRWIVSTAKHTLDRIAVMEDNDPDADMDKYREMVANALIEIDIAADMDKYRKMVTNALIGVENV